MKIIVYHSSYGCDTGCCGHVVEADDGTRPKSGRDGFNFDHPYSRNTDWRKWAEDLVRQEFGEEHVKDLDWDHCTVSDD